jgi:hypothetical protein
MKRLSLPCDEEGERGCERDPVNPVHPVKKNPSTENQPRNDNGTSWHPVIPVILSKKTCQLKTSFDSL